MSIFTTKPIEQIEAEQLGPEAGQLQRVLGAWQLVMLGVGAIIGTGIFVLTGQSRLPTLGPPSSSHGLGRLTASLRRFVIPSSHPAYRSRARLTRTRTRRWGNSSRG